ncbi:MAG: hypothetical protein M3O99_01710 [Chloroflexota bacterium]|nr:hypothetical protein [Chloroflexota bacterium]
MSGAILPQRELTRMVNEVSEEVVGSGPTEFLLKDLGMTEVIAIKDPTQIRVPRTGVAHLVARPG